MICNTGAFEKWPKNEIHDVACSARIKKFTKGSKIVKQAENFDYFGIVTKGVCSVLKYADGKAQIQRSINDLEQELKRWVRSCVCYFISVINNSF